MKITEYDKEILEDFGWTPEDMNNIYQKINRCCVKRQELVTFNSDEMLFLQTHKSFRWVINYSHHNV